MVTRKHHINTFVIRYYLSCLQVPFDFSIQFRKSEGTLYISHIYLDILIISQFQELLKTNNCHKTSTMRASSLRHIFPSASLMANLYTADLCSRRLLKEVNSRMVKKKSVCKNILWYALCLHIVFNTYVVRYATYASLYN
jgi:hypothetical protein